MGICSSCFRNSSEDYTSPDIETRRRQQAEAAQRRLQEQENRGIKDPEKVKQLQKRAENTHRLEDASYQQGSSQQQSGLRWQVS